MKEKDRSIKNNDGVPIWVRADCQCATCNSLRKLEQNREMSKLDQEFDKVASQINSKIQAAAKLMKEANQISLDAKVGLLGGSYYEEDLSTEDRAIRLKIDWQPLFRELDRAGWSTSSMESVC